MVQRFKYFIEFNVTPRPEDGDPKGWRWQGKPDHLRFVWPKLWDTREEAEAFIYALDAGNPDKERQRFRGLFANAQDGGFGGRGVRSAAVQHVRVS